MLMLNVLGYVWLTVSIAVTIISIVAIKDAMLDSTALSAAGINSSRHAAAENNVRQELIRFVTAIVLVLTSASSILIPNIQLLPDQMVDYGQQMRLVSWNIVTLLLGLASILDRAMRRKVMQYAPVRFSTSSVSVPAPAHGSKDPTGAAIETMHAAQDAAAAHDLAVQQNAAVPPVPSNTPAPVLETPETAAETAFQPNHKADPAG